MALNAVMSMLSVIILNVVNKSIMLYVVMLNVIMLCVVMQNVIMLSVVAPFYFSVYCNSGQDASALLTNIGLGWRF